MFAEFEELTSKPMVALRQIEGWKEKVVDWIREEAITGKMVKEIPAKHLMPKLMLFLEPDESSKAFKKLKGPTTRLLKICREIAVDRVLAAAKVEAVNEAVDDVKASSEVTDSEVHSRCDGMIWF